MNPQPKTRIVELFGLPGAGKTTLAKAAGCADAITRHQLVDAWRLRPRVQQASYVGRAFLRIGCVAAAARLAAAIPLTNRESLGRLIKLVGRTEWLKSQDGLMLLDQGLLQELWSILYDSGCEEPDPAVLAPLIRCLYDEVPTTIVFIDTDRAVASERIRGRSHGHSRLDGLSEAQLRGSLDRSARLARRILRASEAAGLEVHALDGSAPIDTLASELRHLMSVRSGS